MEFEFQENWGLVFRFFTKEGLDFEAAVEVELQKIGLWRFTKATGSKVGELKLSLGLFSGFGRSSWLKLLVSGLVSAGSPLNSLGGARFPELRKKDASAASQLYLFLQPQLRRPADPYG